MILMNNAILVIIIKIATICIGKEVAERLQTTDKDECKAFAVNKFLQILDEARDCNSNCAGGRPTDCTELKSHGYKTGVYMIYPARSEGFKVYCDMDTMDKGWTVFQRRFNGKVDFFRRWTDYKYGFGNVNGEHWLGNKYIHELTNQGKYILRIVMEDFEKNIRYAEYSKFDMDSEGSGYKLYVSGYHGNAGDSFSSHNGRLFSTKDKDNDAYSGHCSQLFKGGWWYSSCHASNLNGLYLNGKTGKYAEGIVWYHWKGNYYSVKTSTMMIRRIED